MSGYLWLIYNLAQNGKRYIEEMIIRRVKAIHFLIIHHLALVGPGIGCSVFGEGIVNNQGNGSDAWYRVHKLYR